MTPAETLVAAARRHGADTMFGVPGGGPNLALIGAAESAGMRFVLSHGETSGAIMASCYGLLIGRPAVAIATRGPGATSAANGVAQATLDRYPLVIVTDCVAAADVERVAHQRLDQVALMGPITKWSGRLGADDAAHEVAEAAFAIAARPPRGAVHLDFDPSVASSSLPPTVVPPTTAASELERACELVAAARRPVVIVGFGAVDDADAVRHALEAAGVPALTTYQAVGLLPEGHPQSAGLYTSGAIERALLDQADLVVAVGLDTVEPMPAPWTSDADVVSISATPAASTFLPATVSLIGPLGELFDRVANGATGHDWAFDAGATALTAARDALTAGSVGTFGPVELATAVARATPAAATVTVDAGAHFLAIMPFWPVGHPLQLLISNGLATMGFALPSAVGAALARPGSPVVCLVGDGGLGMTVAELETLARLQLPVTVVVFDDAALSLIEIKQQPGQGGSNAVRFHSIDFAGVARAMGLGAETVESVAELERALAGGWDRPRLIDARIDSAPYAGLIKTTRG